jgi:hypothetical protein
MDNQSDSTPAFKSLGELTGNIVDELKNSRDQVVASAMRDLESQVHDLSHMARITSDFAERVFHRADNLVGERKVYSVHPDELEAFLFAINNVEVRTREFKTAYLAAFDGRAHH